MNTQELLDPKNWAEQTFGASNCTICVERDERSRRQLEQLGDTVTLTPA